MDETIGLSPTGRDDRKSATLAAWRLAQAGGPARITDFAAAQAVLRDPAARQAGPGLDHFDQLDPERVPVFYLAGEPHRRRRAAIARFFTPRAISTRYQAVMERVTDALLARLKAAGHARLDELSFELAVAVAADIIGLTESDAAAMADRLAKLLALSFESGWGPASLVRRARRAWYGYRFLVSDLRPAVVARSAHPRDDVISQTLERGYTEREILIECMTYAAAGMLTTREFIVMVAWHLFERPDLRERFLTGSEKDQLTILREILRIEPVATLLFRRAAEGAPDQTDDIVIDIRAANLDQAAVGACPFALDPDRAESGRDQGDYLSFGDGSHRCPGAQVAMHETRVFIDRLLRLPGIRLERAPDLGWNDHLMSYELRRAVVRLD